MALNLDRPGEAIEFLEQADPTSPWLRDDPNYWIRVTRAYHRVGDYEGELDALARWRQRRPGTTRQKRTVKYRSLAALGRIDELGALVRGDIQRGRLSHSWFLELRAHGYPAAASDLMDRTLEWVENTPTHREPDSPESLIYGRLLSQAGRLGEARAVWEHMLAVPGQLHPMARVGLVFVLASQGHREEAYELSPLNDLVTFAWIEAALGNRERAMELLRENGPGPDLQGVHGLPMWLEFASLRDYPPFQEFVTPTG